MKNENQIEFRAKPSAGQLSIKDSPLWNAEVISLLRLCLSRVANSWKTSVTRYVKGKELNDESETAFLKPSPA